MAHILIGPHPDRSVVGIDFKRRAREACNGLNQVPVRIKIGDTISVGHPDMLIALVHPHAGGRGDVVDGDQDGPVSGDF